VEGRYMKTKPKYEGVKVDYDCVSEFAGHQPNRGIEIVEASKDIFGKVKNKAMQMAVKGEFIEFETIEELQEKLYEAAHDGFSICLFDEIIGG
jgi:hypothetical protein